MFLKTDTKVNFLDNSDKYILPIVNSQNESDLLKFNKLNCFNWESDKPYRPDTFAKIYVLESALFCELKCYEENPKAVHNVRDDKTWCDSCLEFFVSPVEGRKEYINIETNSKGFFLCEYGKSKSDRVFVKELTNEIPEVSVKKEKDSCGVFWSVKIKLTKEFVSVLYNIPVSQITFNKIKANFYKCGDECDVPHYLSMFPVTTLPPGFHNPDCFKEFIMPKGL